MTRISKACRELYKALQEEGEGFPTIPDSEWSGKIYDLALIQRAISRWEQMKMLRWQAKNLPSTIGDKDDM